MKWFIFIFLICNTSFAQEAAPESDSLFKGTSFQLGYSNAQGAVFMGNNKVSADFYMISLGAKKELFFKNFSCGLEFNILRNKSPLMMENLLLLANYDYLLPHEITVYGQIKYGLGFMRESSNVYKSESYSGSVLGIEVGGKYPLNSHTTVPLDLGLGLWWLHQSHASGYSSSNPNDLILEQTGLKLFIQYNF